jgi:hypothetical protein
MRLQLTVALGSLLAVPAHAADVTVSVQIPQLRVAEYHRPYVAVFVEDAAGKHAANLAVWYLSRDTAEGHGTKWLPDLRQWWRKSGRTLELPVDGVTGPTRPAGTHELGFDDAHPELAKLAPGEYVLVVEAVREVGGRELLRIPFSWPVTSPQSGRAQGSSELGAVSLRLTP